MPKIESEIVDSLSLASDFQRNVGNDSDQMGFGYAGTGYVKRLPDIGSVLKRQPVLTPDR